MKFITLNKLSNSKFVPKYIFDVQLMSYGKFDKALTVYTRASSIVSMIETYSFSGLAYPTLSSKNLGTLYKQENKITGMTKDLVE